MKKIFVCLIMVTLITSFLSPVQAETLKTGIEKVWTVDSARQEAFKDAKQWIDLSWADPIDPDLIENKKAINLNKLRLKDRAITVFGEGDYCIDFFDDITKTYFYNVSGKLSYIDFYKYNQNNNILKTFKHKYPEGILTTIGIDVSKGNTYAFYPSGDLVGHWVGDTCYDVYGNVIETRELIKGN